ncbi:hypothetical protein CSKR_104286 [Clonorchis sinensis]|uniref:Uncharacterized protein n=1 Tax=Clonorchis sinensis TaxID=79923 RepID=A0A419Q110_CLOSI|nr:hypothetical protein CSKR_104286 [Clonorchis sinensis]
MTSMFNTDASLPYNHGLFESLIVKKRIKADGEGTCVSKQAQWGSRGPNPGRRVAPKAPKLFVISFIPLCQVKELHAQGDPEVNSTNSVQNFPGRSHTLPLGQSSFAFLLAPHRNDHGKQHPLWKTMNRHAEYMTKTVQLLPVTDSPAPVSWISYQKREDVSVPLLAEATSHNKIPVLWPETHVLRDLGMQRFTALGTSN